MAIHASYFICLKYCPIVKYLSVLHSFFSFIFANTTIQCDILGTAWFFSYIKCSEIDKRLNQSRPILLSFYRKWIKAYSLVSSCMTYINCVWLWFSNFPQWEGEISPPPMPSCCQKGEKMITGALNTIFVELDFFSPSP